MNIYGDIVKKKLIDMHENQQYIADKTGLSRSAIANLLNRDNISLDKMQQIATALNCTLKIELIPNDDK